MSDVATVADVGESPLARLLQDYGLELVVQPEGEFFRYLNQSEEGADSSEQAAEQPAEQLEKQSSSDEFALEELVE